MFQGQLQDTFGESFITEPTTAGINKSQDWICNFCSLFINGNDKAQQYKSALLPLFSTIHLCYANS